MLHPQAQAFIERLQKAGTPSFRKLGVGAMRANGSRLRRLAGPVEPLARVEDIIVSSNSGLKVRRYSPVVAGEPRPTLVFAHGGGWVAGSIDDVDAPLSALANRSGWDIVSVDYRLAPEHPYPASADDVRSALAWSAESASVLAIAGESAGGALAVGAALWWRDQAASTPLALLAGIYPALGADLTLASYERNGAYGLTRDDAAWFLEQYLPQGVDRTGAIPLEATSLSGLPQTFVLSAECDVLIDEAVEFVSRLRSEGVKVDHHIEPGMVHGFFQMGTIMDAASTAVDLLSEQLSAVAVR